MKDQQLFSAPKITYWWPCKNRFVMENSSWLRLASNSPDYKNHPSFYSLKSDVATSWSACIIFLCTLPLQTGGTPVRMNRAFLSFFQGPCSTFSAKAGYERQHYALRCWFPLRKILIWSHGQEINSLNTRLIFPVDHNSSKLASIFLNYNAKNPTLPL